MSNAKTNPQAKSKPVQSKPKRKESNQSVQPPSEAITSTQSSETTQPVQPDNATQEASTITTPEPGKQPEPITQRIPQIEHRPIDTLQPFPTLQDVFDPLQRHRFDELKQSIADRGLEAPPVIWQGYIVSGANRVRACRELGWSHIPVIDRSDLGRVEAEILFIEANTARRELSINEKMRAAGKLKKLIEKATERIQYGTRPAFAFGQVSAFNVCDELDNDRNVNEYDCDGDPDNDPGGDDEGDDSIIVVIGSQVPTQTKPQSITTPIKSPHPTDPLAQTKPVTAQHTTAQPTSEPGKPKGKHASLPIIGNTPRGKVNTLPTTIASPTTMGPTTQPTTITTPDQAASKLGVSRRQFDELAKANDAPEVIRSSVGEGLVPVTVKQAAAVTRALDNPALAPAVEANTKAFAQAVEVGSVQAAKEAKRALLSATKGKTQPTDHTIESGRLLASLDTAKGRIQVTYRSDDRALPVLLISTKGLGEFTHESYQEAFELALALLNKRNQD